MNQWFERLTEKVTLAHDEQAVRSALHKLTNEADFDAYAYVSFHADSHTTISSHRMEWQDRYRDKSYLQIDPVVRKARQCMEAFAWSNQITSKVPKERRVFYGEAAEFGIRSGLSIPIKTGFSRMAMLTLTSNAIDVAGNRVINPVLAAAAVAQVHAKLDNVRLARGRRTDIRLKSDELTCLRWSAEGKSMKAIAIIENTTYANVCFFLRNAKVALGASTLPQATAMAKEFGLI